MERLWWENPQDRAGLDGGNGGEVCGTWGFSLRCLGRWVVGTGCRRGHWFSERRVYVPCWVSGAPGTPKGPCWVSLQLRESSLSLPGLPEEEASLSRSLRGEDGGREESGSSMWAYSKWDGRLKEWIRVQWIRRDCWGLWPCGFRGGQGQKLDHS